MSSIAAAQLTAVATTVLAALAIATAIVAGFALKKQSDALNDSRKLIRQQGGMLQVQSDPNPRVGW